MNIDILRSTGSMFLDLLYPPVCPICERLLKKDEHRVCRTCAGKLPYLTQPRCMKCGRTLKRAEDEYCPECLRIHHIYDAGECTFRYEKKLRSSVLRMKFHNHRDYLPFYAEEMAASHRTFLALTQPQVILPVPMNKKKRKERGFDQCALLGKYLSGLTGIPVRCDLLVRTRYTRAQKGLNPRERKANLAGAFSVPHPEALPERVLLLDDIYTTGSTVDEAARTLKTAGVRQVYYLAVCMSMGTDN